MKHHKKIEPQKCLPKHLRSSPFDSIAISKHPRFSVSGAPNKQALNNAFGIEPNDPYLHLTANLGPRKPDHLGFRVNYLNQSIMDVLIQPYQPYQPYQPTIFQFGSQHPWLGDLCCGNCCRMVQNFRYSMIFLYKYVLHWALFIPLKSNRKIANKAKLAKTSYSFPRRLFVLLVSSGSSDLQN